MTGSKLSGAIALAMVLASGLAIAVAYSLVAYPPSSAEPIESPADPGSLATAWRGSALDAGRDGSGRTEPYPWRTILIPLGTTAPRAGDPDRNATGPAGPCPTTLRSVRFVHQHARGTETDPGEVFGFDLPAR